jgi:hypothetical protein
MVGLPRTKPIFKRGAVTNGYFAQNKRKDLNDVSTAVPLIPRTKGTYERGILLNKQDAQNKR